MKKQVISLVLIFTVLLNINNIVMAAKKESKQKREPYPNAVSAVVIDNKTGALLFGKNENSPIAMASTTKIITALVAIENNNLDKVVKVSSKARSINGCKVGYRTDEEVTIRELCFGLMLRSGNDAAIAIAEGISGSVDGFLDLMNEKARSLGLINCHFETPNGLDSNQHFTTAKELALITREAKKYPLFNEIVTTKQINKEKYNFTREYLNINKLIYQLPEATGVKTGYTGMAGKCLVGSSKIGENEIIEVVLNCNDRYNEIIKLHNYVKENFEFETLYQKDEIVKSIKLGNIKYDLGTNESIIIPKKNTSKYETNIITPKNGLKFALKPGDPCGALVVKKDGEEYISYKLYVK